jgi:hypothetical protein
MADYTPLVGAIDHPTLRVKGGSTSAEKMQRGAFSNSVSSNYMVDYKVLQRESAGSPSFSMAKMSLFSFRVGLRDLNVSYFWSSTLSKKHPTKEGSSKIFGDFYKELCQKSVSHYDNKPEIVTRKIHRGVTGSDFVDQTADFADAYYRSIKPEHRQALTTDLIDDVHKISTGEIDLGQPNMLKLRADELSRKYMSNKRVKNHEQAYFSLLNHTLFGMIPESKTTLALYELSNSQQVPTPNSEGNFMTKFLSVNLPFPEKVPFVKRYVANKLCE